jgi:hypothetical protein
LLLSLPRENIGREIQQLSCIATPSTESATEIGTKVDEIKDSSCSSHFRAAYGEVQIIRGLKERTVLFYNDVRKH